MNGKEYNAVVYSEYSGDSAFDEPDRLAMDKVVEEGKRNWNVGTFAKEGTEAKLDMKTVKKGWEIYNAMGRIDDCLMYTNNSYGDWLELKNLKFENKGEIKLLKIIVKSKETGIQKCIDIPEERESEYKTLKVGMAVGYLEKVGKIPELVEIVKIVDNRPKVDILIDFMPYPWQKAVTPWWLMHAPRRAYKTTFSQKFWDDIKKMREEREEIAQAKKEYQEKPYFFTRLDILKGKSDGIENLEKMKFPCWVVWKDKLHSQCHLGQLITGYPSHILEYQLVDMDRQVKANECCTIARNTDLKTLMDRWSIEVIKGETQLYKIGKFNV